jgi:hypothetical protein
LFIKNRTALKIYQNLIILLITSLFHSLSCSAYSPQDTVRHHKTLDFFLDCEACDFTFVRQELPFVSFVRDPKLSDVHILSSISHTGSGAHKYFISFIGMEMFKGMDFNYELVTDPSYTEDDTRNGLLKIIKAGILPYYSKSGNLGQLDIDLIEKQNSKAENVTVDRWNKWIFRLSSGASFQKEESQNEASLESSTRIEKITSAWKTRFEASYEIDRESYFDDGTKYANNQDNTFLGVNYIKSLGQKWSAGIFGEYSSSTYLNIKNSFKTHIGIEHNFFPWEESSRRILSVGYYAGISGFDYHEITIYDKLHEFLSFHSIRVNSEFIEPWGTAELILEARHLFNDFKKNRFTIFSDVSLRITKQISVYFEINTQFIHDQLYLPRGDASVEDVLLQRRKLATTYEFEGNAGFRFTFGSIYSNVVNERFK